MVSRNSDVGHLHSPSYPSLWCKLVLFSGGFPLQMSVPVDVRASYQACSCFDQEHEHTPDQKQLDSLVSSELAGLVGILLHKICSLPSVK